MPEFCKVQLYNALYQPPHDSKSESILRGRQPRAWEFTFPHEVMARGRRSFPSLLPLVCEDPHAPPKGVRRCCGGMECPVHKTCVLDVLESLSLLAQRCHLLHFPEKSCSQGGSSISAE